MGKLFKQIFKEDIKTVLPWMLSPLLVAVAGVLLYNLTNLLPVALIIFISIAIMSFAPLISIATIAGNDNARFYGKKAVFYSCLPVKPIEVTGARLINFIMIGLIIGIFSLFNTLFFGVTSDTNALDPLDILKSIIKTMDINILIILIKSTIILILIYAIFALEIMAANTLGSARPLNKIGKSAKGVLFAAMFLIQAYIYTKTIYILGNSNLVGFREYSKAIGTGYINMLDLNWSSFTLIIIILAIFTALYFVITSYFHKEKISVQ